jgi:CBS domain-containing protein
MIGSVASIGPNATLHEAATALQTAEVGTLAIMDGPQIAGIVSERDLVRALSEGLDPDQARVEEIMTRDPRYVTPSDPVDTALGTMLAARIRHLPVLDEGELVGIVSIRDLAAALLGRDLVSEFEASRPLAIEQELARPGG